MKTAAQIIAERYGIDKKYQFTIEATGFSQILNYAPDNFFNGQMKLVRNKTFRGMFRYIASNMLTFYKDGRDILKNFYDTYGIDYNVILKVEVFNNGVVTPYVTLKLDFATYKLTDVAVEIQAVDSSFMETVKNRENININLFSLTSIDGTTLTPFTANKLNLINTSLNKIGKWLFNGTQQTAATHILPLTLQAGSNFLEAQNSGTVIDTNTSAILYNSKVIRPLKVDVNIVGDIRFSGSPPTPTDTYTLFLFVINNKGYRTQDFKLGSTTIDPQIGFTDINIVKTIDVTINTTDSIILQAYWGAQTGETLTYTKTEVNINENLIGLPIKEIYAFPIYEAFLRIIQQITGVENSFRSDTFGRTDTPFITYPVDGILLHLVKGRMLRDGSDMPFPLSLKTLFESVNSLYNIGLAVEGGNIVRIEKIDYFYQNTIVLDVSNIVTEEITTMEVSPTDIYKDIIVGFQKFGNHKGTINDISGIEFNTKANYTTEIKSVTTSLSKLSEIRGDSTEIIKLANDTDLTKNASGDNDIFFIKTVRDTSGGFKVETNEQFSVIDGAPYETKTLNLDLSPARSVMRWGNIIHAGLKTGKIRWQNTDNNYQLSTQKTTETVPVTEKADIDYSVLDAALYRPEKIKVKVPLTFSQINTIFENPYGLINISTDKQGWVDEMVVSNKDNMVQLTLIRK